MGKKVLVKEANVEMGVGEKIYIAVERKDGSLGMFWIDDTTLSYNLDFGGNS